MLVIENVTVRFDGVTALSEFSAQVPDGEICGFIGPNGAGKTTLFNCCTRVVQPTAGRISFDGQDLLAKPVHGVIRCTAPDAATILLCHTTPWSGAW